MTSRYFLCLLLIGGLTGCEPETDALPEEEAVTGQPAPDSLPGVASMDEAAPDTLPHDVAATREDILQAARETDYNALQSIVDESPQFNYSFGGSHPGGATGYWQEVRSEEYRPLEILAELLQLAPVRRDSLYVWPGWAYLPLDSLNPEQIEEFEQLVGEESAQQMLDHAGGYIGPRVGITLDGEWTYYVAGD